MKIKSLAIVILSAIVILLVGCVSYPKEIRKALKQSLGLDFPSYSFRGTPRGLYGVGMLYNYKELSNSTANEEEIQKNILLAYPGNWYDISLPISETKAIQNKIIVNENMGFVSLEKVKTSNINIEVILPEIQKITSTGVDLNIKRGLKLQLRADNAVHRQLNWSEFIEAINNKKIKGYVKEKINEGNVVLGIKDIILNGYSIEISVDQTINPELSMEISKFFQNNKNWDGGLGLKTNIDIQENGKYIIKIQEPVVAAVLYAQPPKIATTKTRLPLSITPSTIPDFAKWKERKIDNKIMDPIEELLQSFK